MTTLRYSQTARVTAWGHQANARRVTHLTPEERDAVRAGEPVFIAGCPDVRGTTDRRVVAIGRHFYTRMP
jgi:hypothetical protein